MNLLEQFISFLKSQKNGTSFLTIKNYKADINQFISWFEKKFSISFDPSKITLPLVEEYRKNRNLSPASTERHLSSLRRFFKFLKEKEIISYDLPEKKTVPAEALVKEDPWRLRNFKNYLYECKKSNLTIKNYVIDIKNFFLWLEEVSLNKYAWKINEKNLLEKLTLPIVNEYKQRLTDSKFSPRTINRKLSSLRNYIRWAQNQGLIPPCHPELVSGSSPTGDSLRSNEMLKPAQHDTEKIAYSSFPPYRLTQKSIKGANLLFDKLLILPLAKTILEMQYVLWKISGKKIFIKPKTIKKQNEPILNIRKELYAPLSTSLRYLPKHKKAWHILRYYRPKWYKTYHSYTLTHYLHFAILVILCSAVGFGMYNGLFADAKKGNAIAATESTTPLRILSFKGKLFDSKNTPITKPTNVLFSIYNNEKSPSDSYLWKEINNIVPDSDGTFSTLIGKKTPIPEALFSQNPKLFLGIAVDNAPELSPRQQLATVPFASNSETLQGLQPITNTDKASNVVLALDSSGNLTIAGSKSHTFQTIGGQFIVSGNVLSLNTAPGSNSNIEIAPDGAGRIDLSKPIHNSTNNNNLSGVSGAVEFDDLVAILATSSAQSAFTINQNSTGQLISANTSGIAKFTVGSDGDGMFAGNLSVNGGSLTGTSTTFDLLNSTITTLNIGGSATTINLGVADGTINFKSNINIDKDITLSSLKSNGGILYTNDSGKILQVLAGSSSDCLMGGSSPSFSRCPGVFNQANGSAYTDNSTLDILLGGNSTESAKIAFINLGSGTPTASISGDITLNSAGVIRTTNLQTLTLGDASTGNISFSNAGNIGIGTNNPSAKFDVVGGQTQIEVSTQYSQRLCHNGTNGSSTQSVLLGDCGPAEEADIAEYYGSKDVTIEAGDIVAAAPGAADVGSNSKAYANKSSSSYQTSVIGIVSTNPYDSFGKNFDPEEHSFPVALIGRVPLKISLENGPVKAGDLLASSSIPGVAMKATRTGIIVAKALEDLESIDEPRIVGFYDPENKEYRNKANFPDIKTKPGIIKIAKIHVFANVSWYDPGAYLAQNGDLVISSTGSNGYAISNSNDENLTNIGGFWEIIAANIKAGLIKASEITTDSLIVTSDSIIVGGQNIKDFIVQTVKDAGLNSDSSTISPVINVNQISTDIISPLSSDNIIVKLASPSGSFAIQNSEDSTVAQIDNEGNASFSGRLTALSSEFNDSTISGTLRAKNIIADSIEGLEAKISTIAANTIFNTKYLTPNTDYIDISSYAAQLAFVESLQAEQAQFNQGLMVFGPTSLSDVAITGQLSINATMFFTNNSIETLGTELSLQSLRQGGLSIMGGLVYVDTDGNLKLEGDLSISGKLAVNIISPLPSSDLAIKNASGSSVLSINQNGDINASGSGTFAKLNLSLVQPALALSPTELIASSSAGTAEISPYQSEVTIRNSLVTANSVIYITPVGTPSAQSPFLMRQIANKSALNENKNSFTVGVQSPTFNPIPFNWLIVN
ncbi:MAG: site-specific integrase [Candidatus Levybacteria bacterium]|nr:site-specific integrase [Candidatus Levybacteria bacterium]